MSITPDTDWFINPSSKYQLTTIIILQFDLTKLNLHLGDTALSIGVARIIVTQHPGLKVGFKLGELVFLTNPCDIQI